MRSLLSLAILSSTALLSACQHSPPPLIFPLAPLGSSGDLAAYDKAIRTAYETSKELKKLSPRARVAAALNLLAQQRNAPAVRYIEWSLPISTLVEEL